MKDILRSIADKQKEAVYLREVLEMWAEVQEQGINPEDVDVFGFKIDLLSEKDKEIVERYRYLMHTIPANLPLWYGKWLYRSGKPYWYNYVRLKNGNIVTLSPMIRAR